VFRFYYERKEEKKGNKKVHETEKARTKQSTKNVDREKKDVKKYAEAYGITSAE